MIGAHNRIINLVLTMVVFGFFVFTINKQWFHLAGVMTRRYPRDMKSSNAPPVPPVEVKYQNPPPMMTAAFTGRTGNLMFQYAVLYATAKRHNALAVIPCNFELREMFKLTAPSIHAQGPVKEVFKEGPKEACRYDPKINNISTTRNTLSRIAGYLQSWKYFRTDDDVLEIREQFKFRPHIKKAATNFIDRRKFDMYRRKSVIIGTTVGVHVRRGDLSNAKNKAFGYVITPVSYIKRAMVYITSLYGAGNTLFIVASDDIKWCRENIPQNYLVVFSENVDAALDMAILSSCDHVIMTTGTFGWWSAWLANGTTIYYKDSPRINSELSLVFSHEDHYLPHWIGLSG